jgi:transcriptional regulator with XRE-family HTH domain
MMSAFGEAIRSTRKRRNLSQQDLATETGLHRKHISLLERGLREPSVDTLVTLCRALEVSPAEAILWHLPGPRARRHEADAAAVARRPTAR